MPCRSASGIEPDGTRRTSIPRASSSRASRARSAFWERGPRRQYSHVPPMSTMTAATDVCPAGVSWLSRPRRASTWLTV